MSKGVAVPSTGTHEPLQVKTEKFVLDAQHGIVHHHHCPLVKHIHPKHKVPIHDLSRHVGHSYCRHCFSGQTHTKSHIH